jgi:hypothetical protein
MLARSFITGSLAAWIAIQGSPPPAPACYLLTASEVSSIIGTARTRVVTAGPLCTFENGASTLTVRLDKPGSADAAKEQWEVSKRAAAAQDVAGWPTSAYAAAIDSPHEHAAIVGVYVSDTFVEAKAVDAAQKTSQLSAELQTAMKAFSGRLAAQK